MTPTSASSVRLLAAWVQARRALTARVEGLLLHGPTAVDRVAAREAELRTAAEAERAAFEAFVAHVRAQPGTASDAAVPVDGLVVLPESFPPLRSIGLP